MVYHQVRFFGIFQSHLVKAMSDDECFASPGLAWSLLDYSMVKEEVPECKQKLD